VYLRRTVRPILGRRELWEVIVHKLDGAEVGVSEGSEGGDMFFDDEFDVVEPI